MKIWLTEIRAIDPLDGEMKTWCGPRIPAISWSDAEEYVQRNGLSYCKVIGQLIEEIPCNEKTGEPEFHNKISFENLN